MAEFVKKCCQCCWCSQEACGTARFVDVWHGCEACGLAWIYCDLCCWTWCAPLFIDCQLGDFGKACDHCTTGCKYCVFGCGLQCIGMCDGCYNCFMIASQSCSEGITGHADLRKNVEFLAAKWK